MQRQYQTAITREARGDKFAPDSVQPSARVETVEKKDVTVGVHMLRRWEGGE